jgi:hypothetical protein
LITFSTPAFCKGCVLPPIHFKVTIGNLYSLQGFISVRNFEWDNETDPQESNLASIHCDENTPFVFLHLIFAAALQMSLVPGAISLASSMQISTTVSLPSSQISSDDPAEGSSSGWLSTSFSSTNNPTLLVAEFSSRSISFEVSSVFS